MGGDAPFMGVYGDYVDEREQTGRKEATQTTAELAGEASPASTLLSLPDEGDIRKYTSHDAGRQ